MLPSALCFIVKGYLQPTCFFPVDSMHFSQVLFRTRACISSSIADFQFLLFRASSVEVGIFSEYRAALKAFAFRDKFPSHGLFTRYFDL